MPSLHLFGSKPVSFVLQKKTGSGPNGAWETLEEYPASTYKTAPLFADVESICDEEGQWYRTAAVYPDHDPVPDQRLGTWSKKVKGTSRRGSPSTDVGRTISDAVKPAVDVFNAFAELRESMEKAFYPQAEGGEAGNGNMPLAPGSSPETAVQMLQKQFSDAADMVETFKKMGILKDYSPQNPQYPALSFKGDLPIMMHPYALKFTSDFIKEVFGQLGETAQTFGYKFREGFNGKKPGTPETPQAQKGEMPQQEVKALIEDQNSDYNSTVKKLDALAKRRNANKTKKGGDDSSEPKAAEQPQVVEVTEPVA